MRRRVAVTGMGVVCPLGGAVEAVWASALAGHSAIESHAFTNAATGAYSINLRLGETGTWVFRWETNSNAHIDGSVIITGSRFYPSGTA